MLFSICVLFLILSLSPESTSRRERENSTGRTLLLLNNFGIRNTNSWCYDPEEIHLNAPELIRHRGFSFECHTVTTADGYILEIHRIPAPGRPAILAFHGMFQSSRDFLMNCGRKPFAFYMWDAGYDVWLANVRGNPYSRAHLTLNADRDVAYWDFSVDQVIQYDAPALIDYVLIVTGTQTLSWVGYSLGTAVVMGLGSVHPEYATKLNLVFLLGTSAYVGNTKSPIMRALAPLAKTQDVVLTMFNHGETLPLFLFPFIRTVFPFMCSLEAKTSRVGLCSFFLYIIAGFNPEQSNPSILPLMLGGTPGSLSIKMLSQWYQWMLYGNFSYYDYGRVRNVRMYGKRTPPNYDLSKVYARVVNIWSENDWLAVPQDVQKTVSELPNVVQNIRVSLSSWNHLDFIYGKDSDLYVYKHIVSALSAFT